MKGLEMLRVPDKFSKSDKFTKSDKLTKIASLIMIIAFGVTLQGLASESAYAIQTSTTEQASAAKQASAAEQASAAKQASAAENDTKSPNTTQKMTRSEKRRKRVMDKYDYTGAKRDCVTTRLLRHSRVIDDSTIFFEGPGKKAYMVNLPRRCSRLASEDRFSYTLRGSNQLCRLDLITVIDSFGRSWGSCGMGEFEEMVKKPKPNDSDK